MKVIESPQLASICGVRPGGWTSFSRPEQGATWCQRGVDHHYPGVSLLQGCQARHFGLSFFVWHQEVLEGAE